MGEGGKNAAVTSPPTKADMNGSVGSDGSSRSKHRECDRRKETEEERKIRKDKERKEREERYKKEGKRPETEEERRIRKEKEREERYKKEGKRPETEEERRKRKEKETEERYRKEGKRPETEEERRKRKERERAEKKKDRRSDESKGSEDSHQKEPNGGEVKVEPKEVEDEPVPGSSGVTNVKEEVKSEPVDVDDDDEDMPLARTKRGSKRPKSAFDDSDDDDDVDVKKEEIDDDFEEAAKPSAAKKRRKSASKKEEEDDLDDFKPKKSSKKSAKDTPKSTKATPKAKVKKETEAGAGTTGRKKKTEEEEKEVWKWWEEEKKDDGTKWKFLQHRGPLFAPPYVRLPDGVNFYYNQRKMVLGDAAEEIACFYGQMLDHDYTTKEVFNKNFFKDWRKSMTPKEKEKIVDLSKCDFNEINTYFKQKSEDRKARSKEERLAEKEEKDKIQKEYGTALLDGHEEKIGNFRIEPPGLFRGRGEHPKQGMVKRRVEPEDVIINCSADSEWPKPPEGHKWKEVRHDNTVTWLASWTENIQNQIKYVMLNPSSRLKGEKDMEKYEKARMLKDKIVKIRQDYTEDFKSKEMRVRQRAVALYFIDKLALRAGNEKDEDQADTVGCCSLRVEHITLHDQHLGKEYCVEFDFLGKDSIRYHNIVQVEKRVYKNLTLFVDNKKEGDDLFDRLNTTILNEYLSSLMPGLTAKVFRTYNASITLQQQLKELTDPEDNIPSKMLSYNRANRAVAVLCNHQRAVPKTHETSMTNLQAKIDKKEEDVKKAEKEFKTAKKEKKDVEKKKAAVMRLLEQLDKLEKMRTDKEENKQIALGTSKLNYLDPRISVAWCKKHAVPIEKVYNKTQREKFRWAIDMADEDYEF